MNYLQVRTRTQYLRGEEDTYGDTVINDHIQYAILDILNEYPFSWDITSANLTLSSGIASLPSTYNPKWKIKDARITVSSTQDDHVFTEINIDDRDKYSSSDYVYWITYSAGTFTFNTPVQTGTVAIYYYYNPAAMSGDSDACIVPDGEAVAYLAASKMYVGDERNIEMKEDYKKEAKDRVQSMWIADNMFGPTITEGSVLDYNSQLTGG